MYYVKTTGLVSNCPEIWNHSHFTAAKSNSIHHLPSWRAIGSLTLEYMEKCIHYVLPKLDISIMHLWKLEHLFILWEGCVILMFSGNNFMVAAYLKKGLRLEYIEHFCFDIFLVMHTSETFQDNFSMSHLHVPSAMNLGPATNWFLDMILICRSFSGLAFGYL